LENFNNQLDHKNFNQVSYEFLGDLSQSQALILNDNASKTNKFRSKLIYQSRSFNTKSIFKSNKQNNNNNNNNNINNSNLLLKPSVTTTINNYYSPFVRTTISKSFSAFTSRFKQQQEQQEKINNSEKIFALNQLLVEIDLTSSKIASKNETSRQISFQTDNLIDKNHNQNILKIDKKIVSDLSNSPLSSPELSSYSSSSYSTNTSELSSFITSSQQNKNSNFAQYVISL
jgi:hypothetical protein